jgi:murein DD-endopeptidase MepM/ murein hydrolase activator NlpD
MPGPRILLLIAAVGATGAAFSSFALAQSVYERKDQVDARISGLRSEIATARQKEGVLASDIETASSDIDALESRVADVSARLAELESDLARHRARLDRLTALYREQTRRLEILKRQHARAERRLEERLVELYETGQINEIAILLQVETLSALMEQVDYFNEIGRQDKEIATTLERLKGEMRRMRERTAATKAKVAEATAILAEKTAEQRAVQAELIAEQDALEAARSQKRELLTGVREDRHEAEENLASLEAASAQLAATIQAAQAAAASAAPSSSGGTVSGGDATPSASGLIWPVSGVVTSGFGYRWGRLHAGIDISAPAGTPVRAAASGTVIYAGWMGGYGNLVVIDHGGGLATAYAHLSAIWGAGSVSQGQGIGAVGCTGSCTGNHLHFEVRVNGQPVDPLGYL